MPPDLHYMDVSELEPPEPLDRILTQLRTLEGDQILKIRHRREPRPLFALLQEQGFRHICRQRGDGEYRIYIWRETSGDFGPFCMVDLLSEVTR